MRFPSSDISRKFSVALGIDIHFHQSFPPSHSRMMRSVKWEAFDEGFYYSTFFSSLFFHLIWSPRWDCARLPHTYSSVGTHLAQYILVRQRSWDGLQRMSLERFRHGNNKRCLWRLASRPLKNEENWKLQDFLASQTTSLRHRNSKIMQNNLMDCECGVVM